MAKATKRANPIVLRSGMTIGSVSAETDDEYLFNCFVEHPAVSAAKNVFSPGMILVGRTGSGKTAVIRHIEYTAEHSYFIDPIDMSMSYVSNSDTMQFLHAIGADLDLLFQTLWKHVICIEFIRLKYDVGDEIKSKWAFSRLLAKVLSDPRKQKAIHYLREWEGKFWITMDQNIKEITEKYERKLNAELGGEIERFKSRGQYHRQVSIEKKSELIARARKIINAEQLADLSGVIDLLGQDSSDGEMSKFYLLIDKLDERWVDISIRFRLIRALVESLRTFRKIRNLKILVSLRSDVLERVVQETGDLSFQREKFEESFIRLRWTKAELREVVDKRVREMFRRQYSQSDINFEDIFTSKVGSQEPFEYIFERTLMRPRDIISFVNECFKTSEGRYEITGSNIRDAEKEFSRIRKHALEQEWQSTFPTLGKLLNFLTENKSINTTIFELCTGSGADDLALSIASGERHNLDPTYIAAARRTSDTSIDTLDFVKEIISTLYRVGAVGVKLRPDERFAYSHLDAPLIEKNLLTMEVRVRVHPMLWRGLNLQPDVH